MKEVYTNITEQAKEEIRQLLEKYVARYGGSRQRAAESLRDVSQTSVRNILAGKFENVSDTFWRNLRGQIATPEANDWVLVNTPVMDDLTFRFREAQEDADWAWAISPPGSGKTVAAKRYVSENPNTFYVQCDEAMAKSTFAIELARAVGLRVNTQRNARAIIMDAVAMLGEMNHPLIIFDEADKLNDCILYFFITIYNHLQDKAGVVFISTDYIARRMDSGLRRGVKGYAELYSRVGSNFYIVDDNQAYDVEAIVRANGLTDERDIDEVVKETVKAGLNLRRTSLKVRKAKKKAAAA